MGNWETVEVIRFKIIGKIIRCDPLVRKYEYPKIC